MKKIIFLVHGTWGKNENAWYQLSSNVTDFTFKLRKALINKGVDSNNFEFYPFEWNGSNSHSDRLDAAEVLASKMHELREEFPSAKFHFIGHSHGGNVILKALEIYLHKLAFVNVPKASELLIDKELSCKTLLDDVKTGKYKSVPPSKNLDEQIQSLERIIKSDSYLDNNLVSYRVRRQLMAYIYTHVFSTSDMHKIASVVTLGTPFYEKEWNLNKLTKLQNKFTYQFIRMIWGFLKTYFTVIFFSGLFAIFQLIEWNGFNPLYWSLWQLSFWALLAAAHNIFRDSKHNHESEVDTNVYFDEAELPYLLKIVEPKKLFGILNIHSDYLDEAYCFLSSYTSLTDKISDRLNKKSLPKFWDFKKLDDEIGFWHGSGNARAYRFKKYLNTIASSLIKAVFFPIRLFMHKVAMYSVRNLLARNIRMFAMGLPINESGLSSKVLIRNIFKKKFCESKEIDISQILAHQKNFNPDYKSRFEFLWNDDEFRNRAQESFVINTFQEQDPVNQKQLLAIEERVMEFFGVVGLKHSMYYDNDFVINKVADYIINP